VFLLLSMVASWRHMVALERLAAEVTKTLLHTISLFDTFKYFVTPDLICALIKMYAISS
jgi:hypothetical protein